MLKMMKRLTIALVAVLAATVLLLAMVQATAVAAPRPMAQDEDPNQEAVAEAIEAAVVWLVETHQNGDGGFSSFSAGAGVSPSDIGGTLDALWALGVGGADTTSLIAYLEENAPQLAEYVAQDGSTASKALLALANEADVTDFAGLNLVVSLTDYLSPTGQYGVNTAFNQSLAMMGLTLSDNPVAEEALTWLAAQQEQEGDLAGSWDDGYGTAGNADSTALAISALLVGGMAADDPVIVAGRDFLARTQLESGGWEYGSQFGENANSTALTVMALALLGEDVAGESSAWAKDGQTPLMALLDWQAENGAFQADFGDGRFDDFFSTVQTAATLAYTHAFLGRSPLQAATVAADDGAPVESTPTATSEAATVAEQTPPTATVEPTEAPATASAEAVAEEAVAEEAADGSAAMDDSAVSESGEPEASEEEGDGSIWPWVIGGAVVVAAVALAWWLVRRRKEG